MDLVKYLKPVKLQNSSLQGDKSANFTTEDLVFIDSLDDIEKMSKYKYIKKAHPTDYGILNHLFDNGPSYWLRSIAEQDPNRVDIIYWTGGLDYGDTLLDYISIVPRMHIDASKIISDKMHFPSMFQLSTVTYRKQTLHTIEFGEYPQSFVGADKNNELENLFSSGSLAATGKKYIGRVDSTKKIIYHDEYSYKGQKYVRVKTRTNSFSEMHLSNGITITSRQKFLWVKVEPIVWRILNWDRLPKKLNPKGTNQDDFIDARSDHAIHGSIPFHLTSSGDYYSLWQNSSIRGYLNGINVNNIKSNGNPMYGTDGGGDFTNKSFIREAFMDASQMKETNQSKITKKKTIQNSRKTPSRGYGITVQSAPLSIDDQIRFYINQGKPFMLHGASGVGKSRRIRDIDPDFTSIVLRNGMLPEEVLGKNIYPNSATTLGGTWVPPNWYTNLCEKCKKEPNKNHVLFIDEITNVKGTTQSLVYDLILNRSIGPNLGVLPDNVVVVSAGNSKDESEAAYNMPEPLFRRFDAHIYLPLNIKDWLEWGSRQRANDPTKNVIHPIVSAFVATYGKDVFYSNYDPEEPPKYTIDPRGWEQISDIIYDNNGVIAAELITNKVGEKIAQSFVGFAQNPPLTMEDILADNYDDSEISPLFDVQYTLALSLRHANFQQIEKVRDFIAEKLDEEILSAFDSIWVGNDNEKAIALDDIKRKKQANSKTQNPQPEPAKPQRQVRYKLTFDQFINDSSRLFGQDKTIGIEFKNSNDLSALNDAFTNSGHPSSQCKDLLLKSLAKEVMYSSQFPTGYCCLNDGRIAKASWTDIVYQFNEIDISKYVNTQKKANGASWTF